MKDRISRGAFVAAHVAVGAQLNEPWLGSTELQMSRKRSDRTPVSAIVWKS